MRDGIADVTALVLEDVVGVGSSGQEVRGSSRPYPACSRLSSRGKVELLQLETAVSCTKTGKSLWLVDAAVGTAYPRQQLSAAQTAEFLG